MVVRQKAQKVLVKVLGHEEGNDLLEYGFIMLLIAVAAYSVIENLGLAVQDFFSHVTSLLAW